MARGQQQLAMSPERTLHASPVKLRAGGWGARTTGYRVEMGETAFLTVTTSLGRTWVSLYRVTAASRAIPENVGKKWALWERV